jgi:hypothetical protein
LLGNCFGQDASTLYTGGAWAHAAAQTPSASKQAPMENEINLTHRLKLAME